MCLFLSNIMIKYTWKQSKVGVSQMWGRQGLVGGAKTLSTWAVISLYLLPHSPKATIFSLSQANFLLKKGNMIKSV